MYKMLVQHQINTSRQFNQKMQSSYTATANTYIFTFLHFISSFFTVLGYTQHCVLQIWLDFMNCVLHLSL